MDEVDNGVDKKFDCNQIAINAPMGIILLDVEGEVLFINPMATEYNSRAEGRVIKTLARFIRDEGSFGHYYNGGEERMRFTESTGTTISFRVSFQGEEYEGHRILIIYLVEMTKEFQQIQLLNSTEAGMSTLLFLVNIFNSIANFRDKMAYVAKLLGTLTTVDLVGICDITEEHEVLKPNIFWQKYKGVFTDNCDLQFDLEALKVDLKEMGVVFKNDYYLKRMNRKVSILLYPLFINETIFGVMHLVDVNPLREWFNLELKLLKTVAYFLSNIFTRRSIENNLEESRINLERAWKVAEESSRSKSNFLASMSHEIRTPMNGIIGMTGLLRESDLRDDQKEYVENIEYSASTLMTLLNDILDYSKMEVGKFTFEKTLFDFEDFITNLVKMFRVEAEGKGLAFKLETQGDLPKWIKGDATRLRQILFNLMNNARKFTDSGVVTLRIRHEFVGVDRKSVWIFFEVEDTGIGMTESVREKVFSSFYQADSGFAKRFGGTGLGLAISKVLVEGMGGHISATSEYGKGSCFSFYIGAEIARLREFAHLDKKTEAEAEKRENLHQMVELFKSKLDGYKVLIVEDNYVNRKLARELLKKVGLKVFEAENGFEGVEKFQDVNPDIVLMDIHMPGMSGIEATEKIHELQAGGMGADVSIVAMSAHVRKESDFSEDFFADYIVKPIDPKSVYLVLLEQLVGSGDPREDGGSEHPDGTDTPDGEAGETVDAADSEDASAEEKKSSGVGSGIDITRNIDQLMEVCFQDRELVEELYQDFFEEFAESKGTMGGYIDNDNRDAISDGAHKIKGQLANLRFIHAAVYAKLLESEASSSGMDEIRSVWEKLVWVVEDIQEKVKKAGFRLRN